MINYCYVLDDNTITSKFETVYEINEGDHFKLQCIVDGNPLSTISWIFTKNNSVLAQDLNKSESDFDIDFASCFDHGEYKVTAENRRGYKASASTKLAVKCKCFIIYFILFKNCMPVIGVGTVRIPTIFAKSYITITRLLVKICYVKTPPPPALLICF